MKKCLNCGTANFDTRTQCEKCGPSLPATRFRNFSATPAQSQTTTNPDSLSAFSQNSSLRKATKFFLLLAVVFIWLCFAGFVTFWIFALTSGINEIIIYSFVAMLINLGIAIICSCITSIYSTKIEKQGYVETGFKICTFLFVSWIAGILMFFDEQ